MFHEICIKNCRDKDEGEPELSHRDTCCPCPLRWKCSPLQQNHMTSAERSRISDQTESSEDPHLKSVREILESVQMIYRLSRLGRLPLLRPIPPHQHPPGVNKEDGVDRIEADVDVERREVPRRPFRLEQLGPIALPPAQPMKEAA